MTPRVGLVGLGQMGSAMARRLLSAGVQLWLHNRTASKADPLLAEGARWASDPASLACTVDLAISIVADDTALEEVALGRRGLLAEPRDSLTYVDMSTVSVAASARVAEAADKASVPYLRAPVSGSTVLALEGALGVLVSGPDEAYQASRDVLAALGNSVFRLGPAEEARVMKLVLNILVANTTVALGEALVLGERCGLGWEQMLEVFGGSAVGSPLVRYKAEQLRRRDFSPAFKTSAMVKDLQLALDLAHDAGTVMPTAAVCRELMQAVVGAGWGEHDFGSTVLLFEQLAGLGIADGDRDR